MSNKKRYRLSDMSLDEVSLVTSGDDGRAKVVLAKADPSNTPTNQNGGKGMPSDDITELIEKSDLDPKLLDYISGLEELALGISKDDDDDDDDTDDTDDIEDVDDDDDSEDVDDDEDEEDDEEVVKAFESLLSKGKMPKGLRDYFEAKKGKGNVKKTSSTLSKSEVLAKADPEIRALIEKMDSDLEESRKTAQRAEAIAKAERDAREHTDLVEEIRKTMPNVSASHDDLAHLIQRIRKADPEGAKGVEALLRAHSEQLRSSSLFREIGKRGDNSNPGGSDEIAAKAAEIRKANPNLTVEQAVNEVYKNNPHLYDAAERERMETIR